MEAAVSPHLTPRQRQVLDLLVKGYSNAQIANALGVSLDGAKWHVREIIGSLGVDGREDAAEFWREYNGLPRRLRRLAGGVLSFTSLRFAPVAAGLGVAVAVAVVVGIVLARQSSNSDGNGAVASETPTPAPTLTATPVAVLPSPPPATPEAVSPPGPAAVRTLRIDPPTGDCDQVFRLVADKFEVAGPVEFHRWVGMDDTVLLANGVVGHDGGASLDGVTLPDDCFPGAEYVFEARLLGGGVDVNARAVFYVSHIGAFTVDIARPGCNPAAVVIRGSRLPPGIELSLAWGSAQPFTHNFAELGRVTVGSDGSFYLEAEIPFACGMDRVGIYANEASGKLRARWKATFEVVP